MTELLECQMEGCGGKIDRDNQGKRVLLQVSCSSYATCFACNKCGRVHSWDGCLMFNRPGAAIYLRDEGVEMVMEPREFDPKKKYVTTRYLFVPPGKNNKTTGKKGVSPDWVELDPETQLVFDGMDGEDFLFHSENGLNYRLYRGHVNAVEEMKI